MESTGTGEAAAVNQTNAPPNPTNTTTTSTTSTQTNTTQPKMVNSSANDRKENNKQQQTTGKRRAEDDDVEGVVEDTATTGNNTIFQQFKRVRIVNGGNGPIIYCELDVSNAARLQQHLQQQQQQQPPKTDTPEQEYTTFNIRPFTGKPFDVKVPKEGCLFDLYDAIFTASEVPWERQLLSVNGTVLTNDDQQMLHTALPDPKDPIQLNIRMASGMEQAPLNPDFDLLEEETEHYDDTQNTYEVVVNMDTLEAEAQACLQQLYIQDAQSSGETTRTATPTPATPEPPKAPPKPDTRLTGPAKCHFCQAKCRPALQFTCICGNVFCHLHRYHDQHKCTVDVKALDRAGLALANPKVVGDRL